MRQAKGASLIVSSRTRVQVYVCIALEALLFTALLCGSTEKVASHCTVLATPKCTLDNHRESSFNDLHLWTF